VPQARLPAFVIPKFAIKRGGRLPLNFKSLKISIQSGFARPHACTEEDTVAEMGGKTKLCTSEKLEPHTSFRNGLTNQSRWFKDSEHGLGGFYALDPFKTKLGQQFQQPFAANNSIQESQHIIPYWEPTVAVRRFGISPITAAPRYNEFMVGSFSKPSDPNQGLFIGELRALGASFFVLRREFVLHAPASDGAKVSAINVRKLAELNTRLWEHAFEVTQRQWTKLYELQMHRNSLIKQLDIKQQSAISDWTCNVSQIPN
jgi:hypothetical protein